MPQRLARTLDQPCLDDATSAFAVEMLEPCALRPASCWRRRGRSPGTRSSRVRSCAMRRRQDSLRAAAPKEWETAHTSVARLHRRLVVAVDAADGTVGDLRKAHIACDRLEEAAAELRSNAVVITAHLVVLSRLPLPKRQNPCARSGAKSMTSNGLALKSEPPRSKRGATGQSTPGSPTSPSASRSSSTAARSWRATTRARSAVRLAVGEGGLEPPRGCPHWHLKPARLPFRHSPEWRPER